MPSALTMDPRLAGAMDMLRALSRAETEGQTLTTFLRLYPRFRPVHRFVGLAPGSGADERGDARAGEFRVLFDVRPGEFRDGDWEALSRVGLPALERVGSGGLAAELIAEPIPKYLPGLARGTDEVLGDLSAYRSVAALPVFQRGEVEEWVLGFSKDPSPLTPDLLVQAVMVANLLTTARRQQRSIEEARALNRRLLAQFDEVARVQQSLLPRENPAIPGLTIATSYLTSEQAGGDYYDFFRLEGGAWGILIADVSGHGAAASTVVAMLHAILHAHESSMIEPDEVLAYANRRLVSARLEGSFVTAFLGIYDPRSGELRYSSSGHNPPRLKSGRDRSVRSIDGARTLPLGVTDDAGHERESLVLGPLDTLVLYTDGITEAFSPAREMFGVAGLDAALEACSGEPECVVDSVHTALFRHTRTRDRADDQTIVAIRRRADREDLA